jgi:uncharacterized protein (TIGR02231 family)
MRCLILALALILALGPALWPALALADRIEAQGPVAAVTLYPDGATVTRAVRVEAPAGRHDIVVPGLPADTDPAFLRVTVPDGVTLGPVRLATDRAPDTDPAPRPDIEAAQAEVTQLTDALAEGRRGIALIRARAEAAKARAEVVQAQATRAGDAAPDAAALATLAALVADEVLAARTVALQVEAEVTAAERALEPAVQALTRAEARLAALVAGPADPGAVLEIAVSVATAGPIEIGLSAVVEDAGWTPVHDLRLDRAAGRLTLSPGAMAWQATGEDWADVALTLSTALPADRAAPTTLTSDLRRILSRAQVEALSGMRASIVADAPMPETIVMEEAAPGLGYQAVLEGLAFAYRFAAPVTLRTGADDLRLDMAPVPVSASIRAEAAAPFDRTAYMVAEWVNPGPTPVLPGPAMLYADGAFAGTADLPLVPSGGTATTGFGAIDGLTVLRTVPDRSAGETGFLSTANRQVETAVIAVRNLTGETWPLRLLDRVPVSEQDALAVTWSAAPMPGETDVDGQRGVLAWTFDLAPGATQEITLEHRLDWPEDQVLQ